MLFMRQGDIILKPLKRLPKGLTEISRNKEFIVAYGEATGHHHTMVIDKEKTKEAVILKDNKGNRFMLVKGEVTFTHPEHKTITISDGYYMIGQEREYSYFDRELQNVRD